MLGLPIKNPDAPLKNYRVRRPIGKEAIDAIPLSKDLLLTKKIRFFKDTEIFWLCQEIASIKKISIETVMGKTLYIFLDQYLKDGKKKAKRLLPCDIYK